jgi:hypothetical protein
MARSIGLPPANEKKRRTLPSRMMPVFRYLKAPPMSVRRLNADSQLRRTISTVRLRDTLHLVRQGQEIPIYDMPLVDFGTQEDNLLKPSLPQCSLKPPLKDD